MVKHIGLVLLLSFISSSSIWADDFQENSNQVTPTAASAPPSKHKPNTTSEKWADYILGNTNQAPSIISPNSSKSKNETVQNPNFQNGLIAYKARNYREALEYFKNSLGDKNIEWKVYVMVGYCYFHLGKRKETLSAFNKSLIMHPDNPDLVAYVKNPKTIPVEPLSDSLFYFGGKPLRISQKKTATTTSHASYNYEDYNPPIPDDYKPNWDAPPVKK